ncbi:hypothetical protein QVD17_27628 [Tagetes erecta]|uniref:Uncharacterized protein n=1 Tax=Tagetes erecta TaxID=13708 RepID=A0AAD8K9E1_TARER|nr:hypothetical protein QVD17_27628 [Tagetes erecta]
MSISSSTSTDVPPSSASDHQLCYIHCNFCNIVLAVSVPCSSLFDTVTVRCGNCSNIWPMNVGMAAAFHQSSASISAFQDSSSSSHHQQGTEYTMPDINTANLGSSLDFNHKRPLSTMNPHTPSVTDGQEINNHQPEKRQRVPSLYNRFIKEEIQRIKTSNPDISHKEAFSTAAKNVSELEIGHISLIFKMGQRLDNNHHQANLHEVYVLTYA